MLSIRFYNPEFTESVIEWESKKYAGISRLDDHQ